MIQHTLVQQDKPGTYREHYDLCREKWETSTGKYDSLYDLTADTNILDSFSKEESERYDYLISQIHKKMDKVIDNGGCHVGPKHAIRVDDWKSIDEIYELLELIMPIVEREVFGSNAKIEFFHLYRNVPLDNQPDNEWDDSMYDSSWKWHYDDCPTEFLKMLINLNTVTGDSGAFKFLIDENGDIPVIPSYRMAPHRDAIKPQIYPASRIPPTVIKEKLESGWQLANLEGPPGTYGILTPNVYHRASCPKPGTEPRDAIFLFIRPCLEKQDKYLTTDTYAYPGWAGTPERNVKMYELD